MHLEYISVSTVDKIFLRLDAMKASIGQLEYRHIFKLMFSCCFLSELKVHLTPKPFFRSIESTRYSKHLGAKMFEFA